MTDIVCNKCGTIQNHLRFHEGIIPCIECGFNLGQYCSECDRDVCPSCHLWEHVEE